MSLADVASTLAQVPPLLRVAKELKLKPMDTRDCVAAHFEQTAASFPHRPALIFEGRTLSWQELNGACNRYAHALKGMGLRRGDSVSLMMENRVEFIVSLLALNKLGVAAALINTNLTGRPLTHCMSITGSKACIFGEERLAAIAEVRKEPDLAGIGSYLFVPDLGKDSCPVWASDLAEESGKASSENPPDTAENTLGQTALYIFTSGTTGLPKAALLSNRRFYLTGALSYRAGLRCDEKDCIYLCLPLYHATGLVLGVCSALLSGATMFVRRRFSASSFLPEVREYGATCFIYIGEICRYLLQTPAQDDDFRNPLTNVMGNGLRPDVWHEFKNRFGINRVAEFYGSSEGNVGFVNLLNKDCTVGTTHMPIALVRYDVDLDEILRDSDGRCIRVGDGEAGLLLGQITENTVFEGYTSREATESKILRNAFEDGDAWFNTGDLMKTVDVGFALGMKHYQFVDRVGDTFRWKSENVSTNEVGEIINGHPQVALCNVYGVEVPGADGRAGMAALTLAEGEENLELDSFSAHVNRELPPYARPQFLRIRAAIDTTGTFKMVKGELRKEGYDPKLVDDPLFVLKPGSDSYEPLDAAFWEKIRAGEAGY